MPKPSLTKEQINEIINLRKTGHSIPEIKLITGRANASILKYIKDVKILPEYLDILKSKQGGSKERSKKKWDQAKISSREILGSISERDKLIFLAGLYWGEGSKREFNLINGDPYLIKSFIDGLYVLGIKKNEIRFNLRIYLGMDKDKIVDFWINFLNIDIDQIVGYEFVNGNGKNKLKNGMCRVRVIKSEKYFKLIMSMIDLIKFNVMPS